MHTCYCKNILTFFAIFANVSYVKSHMLIPMAKIPYKTISIDLLTIKNAFFRATFIVY